MAQKLRERKSPFVNCVTMTGLPRNARLHNVPGMARSACAWFTDGVTIDITGFAAIGVPAPCKGQGTAVAMVIGV